MAHSNHVRMGYSTHHHPTGEHPTAAQQQHAVAYHLQQAGGYPGFPPARQSHLAGRLSNNLNPTPTNASYQPSPMRLPPQQQQQHPQLNSAQLHQYYYSQPMMHHPTQSSNLPPSPHYNAMTTSPPNGGGGLAIDLNGHSHQKSAAAAFFARQAAVQLKQQVRLQAADKFAAPDSEDEEMAGRLRTNFRAIICRAPPAIPPSLLARLEPGSCVSDNHGLGKVRVMLRIVPPKKTKGSTDQQRHLHNRDPMQSDAISANYFRVDKKRRQVTLLDPSVVDRQSGGGVGLEERNIGVAAPKMFAFDGLYGDRDEHSSSEFVGGGEQEGIAAACLPDLIAAVVAHGHDGCLFSFGHSGLGKSSLTMVGSDSSRSTGGLMPTAIAWLYRAVKERRARTSARFSVRVSAVEIGQGDGEATRDLLERFAQGSEQSPGMYLRNLPNAKVVINRGIHSVLFCIDKLIMFFTLCIFLYFGNLHILVN